MSKTAKLPLEQRAWVEREERRWRIARELAARNPGVDASGIYHCLRNLEKPPSERLRAALHHGRCFRANSR